MSVQLGRERDHHKEMHFFELLQYFMLLENDNNMNTPKQKKTKPE